jgi:hypothetical protein
LTSPLSFLRTEPRTAWAPVLRRHRLAARAGAAMSNDRAAARRLVLALGDVDQAVALIVSGGLPTAELGTIVVCPTSW